jgi:hypothetical protein
MAQTLTRTFPDGDYPQRLSVVWQALEAARKDEANDAGPPLLNGQKSPVDELAEEYQALKDEADADAAEKRRVVTLRAVGRKVWRDLRMKHPPRTKSEDVDDETAKGDRLAGVNTDDVGDDLLFASISEPKFTSRGDYDEWVDELSEGEFQTLLTDAWRLVNVAQFDPKSLPASLSQRSGEN